MKLVICTPTALLVDEIDVRHVRAADSSGYFGVQPGHADLVTALDVSVASWSRHDGSQGFAAVRGGIFRVVNSEVTIASREAVTGVDLDALETSVLDRLRAAAKAEDRARLTQFRLELGAMRLMYQYMNPAAPRSSAVPEQKQ